MAIYGTFEKMFEPFLRECNDCKKQFDTANNPGKILYCNNWKCGIGYCSECAKKHFGKYSECSHHNKKK